MPDYDTATGERPKGGKPSQPFESELLDVLLRGLATARENLRDGENIAGGRVCIGWYVDHDHSCVLLYSNPQEEIPTPE